MPRQDFNENLSEEDDDFEFLLEKYKHLQEQLDELGPGAQRSHSLADELIDDTFVDIPLDDLPSGAQEKENLDDKVSQLEQDFNETTQKLELSENFSGTDEGNDGGEYISRKFSPFTIKARAKKVRTLSELNKMDLVARGIDQDFDVTRTNLSANSSLRNEEGTRQLQREAPARKSKSRRRRLRKNERKRRKASAQSGSHSGNKVSSTDIYEELGVAVKKDNSSHSGKNNR